MTQDEIIEMARQAGGEFYVTSGNQTPTWYFPHSTIYDFADLVAAKAESKEREACAQVAFSWNFEITDKVAEEIRARGEQA